MITCVDCKQERWSHLVKGDRKICEACYKMRLIVRDYFADAGSDEKELQERYAKLLEVARV